MRIVDAYRLERLLQLGRAARAGIAWTALLFCIVAVPSVCLGQTSDAATNRSILEELRAIRASLERLEKGHKALVALSRMQATESQLASLEERRARLSAQERELNEKIAAANEAETTVSMHVQRGDDAPEAVAQAEASLARSFTEQATRTLKEVIRSREALEQEMAKLKERMAAMEKLLEDALR